ncbi:MAG: winged helix-turn-helix transcriptional regulator [Paracoccus sp. (in: a-proteobacteria)]|nr:winged helix-turn-helix transcriptional regulator [Paracoccus sp. (in: a-proteobacteria)]
MTETAKIRYDEGCLAAHALNLIGDRWALLVVRELMFAPKRFQAIRVGIPGITASVLTARLGQLAGVGVLHHETRLGIYGLTDAGRGLLPVLESLCHWALTIPGHDPRRFISPSALMISMRVCLRHRDGVALAGFDLGAEAFQMRLAGGRLETIAVNRPDTPFVLSGTGNTLAAAVYGTAPLKMLADAGLIACSGDLAAAQEFVDRFSLCADRPGASE